jgi:ketosteroid isomerase-like protein
MPDPKGPMAADNRYVAALIAKDVAALSEILSDDFVLVDAIKGSEITRKDLLAALASGAVRFDRVEPSERLVRKRPGTAVVTGRVRTSGASAGIPFSADSRFTHVFSDAGGGWKLMSAQGTPIVGALGADTRALGAD